MFDFKTDVQIEYCMENGVKYIGTAKVDWRLEMEARTRGIKYFTIFVPDQTISAIKVTEDENGDDVEDDVELDLKDIKVEEPTEPHFIPHTLEYFKGKWSLCF